MAENAFLTDRRREFLTGDYDLDDSADRHLKRRTEKGAILALDELIEVAESPHVDNSEVFEAEKVDRLLTALLDEANPDDPEGLVNYHDRLWIAIGGPLREYRDTRFSDGE